MPLCASARAAAAAAARAGRGVRPADPIQRMLPAARWCSSSPPPPRPRSRLAMAAADYEIEQEVRSRKPAAAAAKAKSPLAIAAEDYIVELEETLEWKEGETSHTHCHHSRHLANHFKAL